MGPPRPVRLTLLMPFAAFLFAGISIEHHPDSFNREPWFTQSSEVRSERLFFITRSKNDNRVCYDVRLKNGRLDADEPVSVYWLIPKEKNKKEELSRVERNRAYGFEIERLHGSDSVDVRLMAIPRTLRIARLKGRWAAMMTIDSVRASLDSAFVMADDGILMPKVRWVRLSGTDAATGSAVTDTLRP